MSPFIHLTLLDGTCTSININQIVIVEPKKSVMPDKTYGFTSYTYIVLTGNCSPRDVQQSYEVVMEAIISYYEPRGSYRATPFD